MPTPTIGSQTTSLSEPWSAGDTFRLQTIKRTPSAWNFGGCTDFIAGGASFRLFVAYAPAVFDRVNGSQGISFEFIEPSPFEQRHVMFVVDTDGQFHDTITDPNDPALTALEKSHRSYSRTVPLWPLFRF
jgi:hypothetical protein